VEIREARDCEVLINGSIQSRARVIYCYPLAEARYAVGLELRSAVGTWMDGFTTTSTQGGSVAAIAGGISSRGGFQRLVIISARPNCIWSISIAGNFSASAEP